MSDNVKQGICIVSFDSGGPGTISQLSFLKELMNRLEYDLNIEENTLLPAEYFDIFGGVGWGIVSGVLLGLLRMTPDEAIDELSSIAHAVFPNEANVLATPEASMSKLRAAIEDMLKHRQLPVDIKLNDKSFADSRCKVVLFAPTTETMGHCHPFRNYRSRERGAPNCSVADAICAALANPETFMPVPIGPPRRQQMFAGTPLGFSNPIRAVLQEARTAFGDDTKVALVLSLGSGQSSSISFRSTMLPSPREDFMNWLPRLVEDRERVAKEMAQQLAGVEAYLRLSVDKGLENLKTSDWHRLGTIISHTDAYMQSAPIPSQINQAVELLQSRSGSLTLGELGQANAMAAAKVRYQRQDCDLSLQIQDIARKVDRIIVDKITFIDSIGNRVPIPMELCFSYQMLTTIIQAYFNHQRLPGFRHVKRNQYQLMQGKDRGTVTPARWDYGAIPDGTIEMSILLSSFGYGGSCPRCYTVSQKWHENEWITCESCQKQFKTTQNRRTINESMLTSLPKPASTSSQPRSESTKGQSSEEDREDDMTEDNDDEIKKIRLISAVYEVQEDRQPSRSVGEGANLRGIEEYFRGANVPENEEPLCIGTLWYFHVHTGDENLQWVKCKAFLFSTLLQLTWVEIAGGRAVISLDLLNCIEVRSVPSPMNASARDDIGNVAARRQAAEEGPESRIADLHPFQLLYDDGVERLGADNTRERVRWVGAIWDALNRTAVTPSRSSSPETISFSSFTAVALNLSSSPAHSLHTVSTSSRSSSPASFVTVANSVRSLTLNPPPSVLEQAPIQSTIPFPTDEPEVELELQPEYVETPPLLEVVNVTEEDVVIPLTSPLHPEPAVIPLAPTIEVIPLSPQ